MSDLRTFLDLVRTTRRKDLVTVEREVSPSFETAAMLQRLAERQRSPILYCSRVAGSRLPLVSNVCGSMGRIALGLGASLPELGARYKEATEHPIAPVRVESAPSQAHALTGDAIDLEALPAMRYHEGDVARPYITAGVAVARDPETGKSNLSFHRMMVIDRLRTGFYIEPGKHLDGIYRKYQARGEAMPVAVFIGCPPAWSVGALYSGDADVEEYDIIGGLLRAPLEVTPCLSQPDLVVPAFAEIVLEGTVHPTERVEEGPFGEFTGFGTGVTEAPVFTVSALTHRPDPIFQDIVSGQLEHLCLPMLAIEHRTRKDAHLASANVVGTAHPAPLTTIVALDKQSDDEPRRVIEALLAADIYAKHVIVVDAEVDPSDLRAVMNALALNFQGDRDLVLESGARGTPLDPSAAADGRTAKVGLDATRPLAPTRPVTKNAIPQAILDAVDLDALLGRK